MSSGLTRLRVGCAFDHDAAVEVPVIVLVEPHTDVRGAVLEERWAGEPELPATAFTDVYGNRCRRLTLPVGESVFAFDATATVSADPEPVPGPEETQHRIEALPDEVLHWLLPSRYCESDTFGDVAWELFGKTNRGVERVQAICDWINANIEYGVPSRVATTTAETFERRGGMCRDFAHLGVTLCRALGIPARYVFGYLPEIGVPPPWPIQDFHAWFEVWLGDRWWTFDARFNTPRTGRLPIGHGRDAADVAMITTYGAVTLRRMAVWADEVAGDTTLPAEGVPDGR